MLHTMLVFTHELNALQRIKNYKINVQFQKISILPPQKGLEFPGGGRVLEGQKI